MYYSLDLLSNFSSDKSGRRKEGGHADIIVQ